LCGWPRRFEARSRVVPYRDGLGKSGEVSGCCDVIVVPSKGRPGNSISKSRWEREDKRAATRQYIIQYGEEPRSAADKVNA